MRHKNNLKTGDVIKAQFELFIANQKDEEYSKIKKIQIGKDEYLPGFDELLLKADFQQEMVFNYQFPTDFKNQNLVNQNAIIKIKILSQTKKNKRIVFVYPEFNKLEEQIRFLQSRLHAKEIEVKATIMDIQQKAKSLQQKASEEIQKTKSEIDTKIQKEKADIKLYAMQSFLEDFITPYNNFLLALRAGGNSNSVEVKNYVFGFEMINKQFIDLLNDHNVQIIAPHYLEFFDPEKHYAIDFIETYEYETNTIAKLSSTGLKLNNRVIKPAVVTLYKKISN